MKKVLISFLLLLSLTFTACIPTVPIVPGIGGNTTNNGATEENNGIVAEEDYCFREIIWNGKEGYEVLEYSGDKTTVVIPTIVLNKPVLRICDGCFEGKSEIVDVVIPNSIEAIGSRAFADCVSLTQVVIPDGVKSIAYEAFANCTNLSYVSFPKTLCSIDAYVFLNCSSLTEVVFKNSDNWRLYDGTCVQTEKLKSPLSAAELLLNEYLCEKWTCAETDEGQNDIAYDGSAVTISFYHTMSASNLQPVLEKAIARFNLLYPGITVDHKQVGGFDQVRDQIKNELTVGAQPNIAYCYPDHVALFNASKKVIVLDDFINSTATVTRADGTTEQMGYTQAQLDDFIEGYYNEGKSFGDGKMYTLPFLKYTEVLYYNKTAFDNWANIYNSEKLLDADGNEVENPNYHNEAYNIKVPTTWEEMEETCAKIKALEPKSTPLGYDSEANWFITMCEQLKSGYTSAEKVDGTNYLFDNEANWAFVEKFASWYARGFVTTKELCGGYTSDLFRLAEDAVGKSYMSIASSAGAIHQAPDMKNNKAPFEVGITTVPQVNPEAPKVISQGPSVCLFQSENPQEIYASWLFVKFLTTDIQFQAEFSVASGYVPVIKSVKNYEYYADFLETADGTERGISALAAKVCIDNANAFFAVPAFKGSSTARDQVGLLVQACFANYASAVDKLAMIKEKFDDAIEECEY